MSETNTQEPTQNTEQPTNDQQPKGKEEYIPKSAVEKIVAERLERDRQRYADYPKLVEKVKEFEKQQEQLSQKQLEEKQQYDKIKENWSQKENEYKTLLERAQSEVKQERVGNALNHEILRRNAYPEASELLKSLTKYNDDGTITIRGKDANGMETDLPVDKGVEQFLAERPYLVKGSGQGGGGTSQSGSSGGQSGADENLSQQLQEAMHRGDRKLVSELKSKIRAKHSTMGVSRVL